jgi:hypothetical protein
MKFRDRNRNQTFIQPLVGLRNENHSPDRSQEPSQQGEGKGEQREWRACVDESKAVGKSEC